MIAALVVDEMQAVHAGRTIHLALSGNLDGEWDADRIAQAIANLVAKALDGDSDRPVVLRVAGRGSGTCWGVTCSTASSWDSVGRSGAPSLQG